MPTELPTELKPGGRSAEAMRQSDLSLSDLLRTLRTEAGLTQEELAERAGISVRTISDAERGLRTSLYKDTGERIADALLLEGSVRDRLMSVARRKHGLEEQRASLPDSVIDPSPLIGRDARIEEITQVLISPGTRILTITGPGGVGKTRVAVEAARRLQDYFRNGVFYVSLAAVREPASVLNAMSRVLGVLESQESLEENLIDALKGKHWLVLLDTFEHVVDVAPSLGEISRSCPELRLLITSRIGLGLRGEKQMPLAPLELQPAVSLFLDRARALGQEVEIDEDTTELLSEICRGLDGLPLAIQLAASRLKHLPLKALRDQLGDPLNLLKGGARDLPARQRTMANTIAWSYDLLNPDAQRFFGEVSVFSGGWTLEAAEAICTRSTEHSLLDLSSELIDHNLLLLANDSDGSPRYSMLDTIREFAEGLRTSKNQGDLEERYTHYFLSLAEHAAPHLGTSLQSDWFNRLKSDEDNLHAAFDRMVDQRQGEICLRMAGALWQFWRLRGEFTLGRARMDAALEIAEKENSAALGKALWGAAWLAYHHADFEEASQRGEQLSQWADKTDDPVGRRNSLTIIGKIETAYGRYESALGPLREALAIAKKIEGEEWNLATSYLNLGMAALLVGRHEEAEKLFGEARVRYEKLGDTHFVGTSTGYLAYAALRRGDSSAAVRLFRESLSVFGAEDRWGLAEALDRLAAFHSMDGDFESAAVFAGASNELRVSMGLRRMPEDSAMIDNPLADAREKLGEKWEPFFQIGSEIPLGEVIKRAMGQSP